MSGKDRELVYKVLTLGDAAKIHVVEGTRCKVARIRREPFDGSDKGEVSEAVLHGTAHVRYLHKTEAKYLTEESTSNGAPLQSLIITLRASARAVVYPYSPKSFGFILRKPSRWGRPPGALSGDVTRTIPLRGEHPPFGGGAEAADGRGLGLPASEVTH